MSEKFEDTKGVINRWRIDNTTTLYLWVPSWLLSF